MGGFCARSAAVAGMFLAAALPAAAEPAVETVSPAIRTFQSPHFRLHTDVSRDAASQLLQRMELALRHSTRYWGKPSRGQFECYVAKNVAAWSDEALPHPLARLWIGAVGGATTRHALHLGRTNASRITIFASTQPGVVEHEVVHAYCCQVFGTTGPDWYKEGMAQYLSYALDAEQGVQCPPDVLTAIQQGPAKTIDQVVGEGAFTNGAVRSLDRLLASRDDPQRPVRLADWSVEATDEVAGLYKPYCWSWAVCHFLVNNPNYAGQFRQLGRRYLSDEPAGSTGAIRFPPEAAFEFSQFIEHLDVGYRTNLCAWEWDRRPQPLRHQRTISRRVKAARGYQATGLAVRAGQRVAYRALGQWSTGPDAVSITADGTEDGTGRLIAVLFHEYRLSEPFELGTSGTFSAPGPGHVYVRCRDHWNGLADNAGAVTLKFTSAGN
jgi:hypothetical protein